MKKLLFKKRAPVASGLCAVFLAGCISAPEREQSNNETNTSCLPPYRQVPALVVNNSPDYLTWVAASEEEGVSRMSEFVRTSLREDAYAFFPEKNVWIEMGIHSSEISGGEATQFNFTPVDDYLNANGNISRVVLYHFHPDHIRQRMENEMPAEFQNEFAEHGQHAPNVSQTLFNTVARVINQMPSEQDIYQTILKSCWIAQRHQFCESQFNIVGYEGTFCLKLSSAGLEHYLALSSQELQRQAAEHAQQTEQSLCNLAVIAARNNANPVVSLDFICTVSSAELFIRTQNSQNPEVVANNYIIFSFKQIAE
ncbi:MAG: hypothetical protein HY363_00335 [Candidatus Aenigmarchaeota archaeon]|nr:hypothetical protein [Candidatus Aenigmarchaeota archaeon]